MKRLFLLSLAALPLAASLTVAAATAELRPGILVDPDVGRAYVMRPEGGIEAISLVDGSVLFTSVAGTRPLATAGDWLVTLAEPAGRGSLDLALINLTEPTGVVTLSMPLPPDVKASPVDGLGTSFEVIARTRATSVDLAWTYRWRRISPLPPEEDEQQSGETQGGLRIDPSSQTASAVSYEVAAAKDDGSVPSALDSFVANPPEFGKPVKASATWAVVETVKLSPGKVRLVLRRVAPGGALLAAKTIYEGPAIVQLPSSDSRHVLVGALNEQNRALYSWSLFSLETGNPAGVLGGNSSHVFFSVIAGGNVAYEARAEGRMQGTSFVSSGRALVVARPDGSVVIRRDVRENEYRGSFPP